MKTLYDFIGARPNATDEQLRLLIEQTRVRLKQTGAWYRDENEVTFRQAEEILLNPEAREAYNKEHGIVPGPPLVAGAPVAYRKKRRQKSNVGQYAVLALLLVVLAGILGFFAWQRFSVWPAGIYLKDPKSGARVAVLVGRESDHAFPNGTRGPACQIKNLDTGERKWISEKQLTADFDRGDQAVGADRK